MSPWEVISLPLTLDHTIPFVAAIFRLISGEDALDDAIAIFEAAEEKHGVRCLYTPNSFLGGGYMPRTPDAASLSHLYPLLEDYNAFQTAYVQVDDPALVEEAIHTHLVPFLTETSFVLQSMDFTDDHVVLFSNGLIVSFGFQGWGNVLAEWANTSNWLAPPDKQIRWSYMDFYGNLGPLLHLEVYPVVDRFGRWIPGTHSSVNENSPELIEHFLAWSSVVLNLVAEKTKRQLARGI